MPQKKQSDAYYIPLNEKINKRSQSKELNFFSVEFFPPKTKPAIEKIISSFDNFRQLGALFADITWHSSYNLNDDNPDIPSIQVADIALNYCWLDTMLHLTCVGMTTEKLTKILEQVKAIGIRNILALRGDLESKTEVNDFRYASDLVSFIRKHHGNYFTIAVAGYPIKHPESINKDHDLENLKRKVEAGADFIITQLFFESNVYIKFVEDCRNIGITIPILPGIMPIQNYDSLSKIVRLSQLEIPEKMVKDLEPIKQNDEAVRNYGIDWCIELCREIIKSGCTPGLHFYTLNRQHATATILKALNLISAEIHRPLPWSQSANHRRSSENVRPIFWSSRPQSYIIRTNTWDEFPNGRWGKIDSPSFGSLNDYYLFFNRKQKKSKCLEMWGLEINSEHDVWEIFYCYITRTKNQFGHFVDSLPWIDEINLETSIIKEELSFLNKHGILTINSQPNINGISSNDRLFGWGSQNGYVYQKAYIEFFMSEDKIRSLLMILEAYPLVNYQIINQKGNIFFTNCSEEEPIAVTWGVFPGKEIIQPTIVDIVSFKVWKDEAFELWTEKWATIYPENSKSREILRNIQDSYCLVNLVDNEFQKQTCLWTILKETIFSSTTNSSINTC